MTDAWEGRLVNEQIQQIVQYIAQYREVYSREAIDSQLLAAGYGRQEIDAAWAQASFQAAYPPSEGPIPTPPSAQVRAGWGDTDYQPPRNQRLVSRPLFWGVLIGFIVLSYGLPVLFLALAGFTSDNTTLSSIFGWLTLGSFVVLQLAALVWGLLALNGNRLLGLGLLYGVLMTVVVLPFVAFFILLGICLTSFATI